MTWAYLSLLFPPLPISYAHDDLTTNPRKLKIYTSLGVIYSFAARRQDSCTNS